MGMADWELKLACFNLWTMYVQDWSTYQFDKKNYLFLFSLTRLGFSPSFKSNLQHIIDNFEIQQNANIHLWLIQSPRRQHTMIGSQIDEE
jgi:hypothetical protein